MAIIESVADHALSGRRCGRGPRCGRRPWCGRGPRCRRGRGRVVRRGRCGSRKNRFGDC